MRTDSTVRTPPVFPPLHQPNQPAPTAKISLPRPRKLALTTPQVAAVELVLLTGVAMRFPVRQPLPVLIGWGVFALLALAASVRWHGLCGYQWVNVLRRHRAITRTGARPRERTEPDPLPPVLRTALPDLVLRWHADRGGNKVGLVGFDGGWTAVIRVAPGSRVDRAPLIQELRTAFLESDTWLSGAQLLTFAMPGADRPVFLHWLAVRYRPSDVPAPAEARGGGEAGALRATASAARRLCTRLIDAGYLCSALDVPELVPELVLSLTGTPNPAGYALRGSWRSVLCGPLVHTCYLPARTLTVAPLGAVARGSVFTACSYTLYREPGASPRVDVSVRVARKANSGTTPPPARRLVPAHGRHEPLVLATLPLALPGDPSADRAAYRLVQPQDHRTDR